MYKSGCMYVRTPGEEREDEREKELENERRNSRGSKRRDIMSSNEWMEGICSALMKNQRRRQSKTK